jgi:hypothetical protein
MIFSGETMTPAASDAVKLRARRASEILLQLRARVDVWEAGLLAQTSYVVAESVGVRGIARVMYGSQSLAISDATKNLQAVANAPICGMRVASMVDLIQAAREIETACQRLAPRR